jgi:putative heme iron utilization protein
LNALCKIAWLNIIPILSIFSASQIQFQVGNACLECTVTLEKITLQSVYNYPMDEQSERTLARLIREARIAALGTLHDGEPNLAMVAYSFAEDFSTFYIHVSRLGKHTTDMEANPRVALLIAETDDRRPDAQTLARVSLHAMAEILPRNEPDYARVKQNYLARFPEAEQLFSLGDFNLWKITPKGGRFVAGFGRAFNLVPEALRKVSALRI